MRWIAKDFAFPKSDDPPATLLQLAVNQSIAGTIAFNLWKPVRLIGLVFFAATLSPPISMPKLAVAEDRNSPANDDEIRLAENRILFAISETGTPQRFSQFVFDARARRPNPRHRVVDLLPTRRLPRRFLRLFLQLDTIL